MTLHSLPLFVRLAGRPVMLVGEGEAAAAKRRLLDRAGATVVGENADAALAIVVDDDAAVARLRARGVLVNAVDRPELCDFTLPAIIDRDPVIVAIGTGGASAGLAAALRHRIEALLPAGLGRLALALSAARRVLREYYPNAVERRRHIASLLAEGGPLDPFAMDEADPVVACMPVKAGIKSGLPPSREHIATQMMLRSPDPDDLTLRQARLLANADRVTHRADVPAAILDRARADASRIETAGPPSDAPPGLTVDVEMAR